LLALSTLGLALQLGTASSHAEVTILGDCSLPYDECLQAWKASRVEFLHGESGYLNLAGLFWLAEGKNTFGSAATNALVFPAAAVPNIGTFELRNGRVTMTVVTAADVRFEGRQVTRMLLPDDTMGAPVEISHRSLSWTIIRRDNHFAVRLRDYEHHLLGQYSSLDYFATDPAMRIEADWLPYKEPRIVHVGTVIEGLNFKPRAPGIVRFRFKGKDFELEAYDASGELFFVFGDRTNGRESYPAGRFLYASQPDGDGKVILDFNTAQSPPCAYNDFATCPVASPRNRLATRIEAGERFDRVAH
jgi:uncharacterized protein (DUF1684 family)